MMANTSEGLLFRPMVGVESCSKGQVGKAHAASRLSDGFARAQSVRWLATTAILRLFSRCRPAHIARFVMPVIIWKAIDRMRRRRSGPNISEERGERITPALANLNATTPVSFKRRAGRIQATTFHTVPRAVLRRMCAAVSCGLAACDLYVQASTTLRMSVLQVWCSADAVNATIALAFPASIPTRRVLGSSEYQQSAETLSYEINHRWHRDTQYITSGVLVGRV